MAAWLLPALSVGLPMAQQFLSGRRQDKYNKRLDQSQKMANLVQALSRGRIDPGVSAEVPKAGLLEQAIGAGNMGLKAYNMFQNAQGILTDRKLSQELRRYQIAALKDAAEKSKVTDAIDMGSKKAFEAAQGIDLLDPHTSDSLGFIKERFGKSPVAQGLIKTTKSLASVAAEKRNNFVKEVITGSSKALTEDPEVRKNLAIQRDATFAHVIWGRLQEAYKEGTPTAGLQLQLAKVIFRVGSNEAVNEGDIDNATRRLLTEQIAVAKDKAGDLWDKIAFWNDSGSVGLEGAEPVAPLFTPKEMDNLYGLLKPYEQIIDDNLSKRANEVIDSFANNPTVPESFQKGITSDVRKIVFQRVGVPWVEPRSESGPLSLDVPQIEADVSGATNVSTSSGLAPEHIRKLEESQMLEAETPALNISDVYNEEDIDFSVKTSPEKSFLGQLGGYVGGHVDRYNELVGQHQRLQPGENIEDLRIREAKEAANREQKRQGLQTLHIDELRNAAENKGEPNAALFTPEQRLPGSQIPLNFAPRSQQWLPPNVNDSAALQPEQTGWGSGAPKIAPNPRGPGSRQYSLDRAQQIQEQALNYPPVSNQLDAGIDPRTASFAPSDKTRVQNAGPLQLDPAVSERSVNNLDASSQSMYPSLSLEELMERTRQRQLNRKMPKSLTPAQQDYRNKNRYRTFGSYR